MNQLLSIDLHNCIDALEVYIDDTTQELIRTQAGDGMWNKLEDYKTTLKNLYYLASIYG